MNGVKMVVVIIINKDGVEDEEEVLVQPECG